MKFSTEELEAAATLVHRQVAPTPQYHWPGLSSAVGAEVWVKHENHAPTGAFKVRGADCAQRLGFGLRADEVRERRRRLRPPVECRVISSVDWTWLYIAMKRQWPTV